MPPVRSMAGAPAAALELASGRAWVVPGVPPSRAARKGEEAGSTRVWIEPFKMFH